MLFFTAPLFFPSTVFLCCQKYLSYTTSFFRVTIFFFSLPPPAEVMIASIRMLTAYNMSFRLSYPQVSETKKIFFPLPFAIFNIFSPSCYSNFSVISKILVRLKGWRDDGGEVKFSFWCDSIFSLPPRDKKIFKRKKKRNELNFKLWLHYFWSFIINLYPTKKI